MSSSGRKVVGGGFLAKETRPQMCFILSLSSEASAGWKYNQWLGSTNNWNASGKTWDRKARGSPKQVPSKIFPHSSQRITKGMRSCPDPGTWLEEAALFPGFGWMGQLPRGTEGCQTPHSHPKNRTPIPRTGSQAGLLLCRLSLQRTTWPQDFSVLGETTAQRFSQSWRAFSIGEWASNYLTP